jgi:hypothetical protein
MGGRGGGTGIQGRGGGIQIAKGNIKGIVSTIQTKPFPPTSMPPMVNGTRGPSTNNISGTNNIRGPSTNNISGTNNIRGPSTNKISGTNNIRSPSTNNISGTNNIRGARTINGNRQQQQLSLHKPQVKDKSKSLDDKTSRGGALLTLSYRTDIDGIACTVPLPLTLGTSLSAAIRSTSTSHKGEGLYAWKNSKNDCFLKATRLQTPVQLIRGGGIFVRMLIYIYMYIYTYIYVFIYV